RGAPPASQRRVGTGAGGARAGTPRIAPGRRRRLPAGRHLPRAPPPPRGALLGAERDSQEPGAAQRRRSGERGDRFTRQRQDLRSVAGLPARPGIGGDALSQRGRAPPRKRQGPPARRRGPAELGWGKVGIRLKCWLVVKPFSPLKKVTSNTIGGAGII